MLTLNNIEVRYMAVILVLRGVSLSVPESKIIALMGANGAGKTTTLKAISGLLRSEDGEVAEGSVEFNGVRIDKQDPEKIVRLGIVQTMEGRRVLQHLTAEENLRMGGITQPASHTKSDLELVYSYFPILKNLSNKTSGYLSGGEQQMLVVGRALMSNPKLMLLDEASLGLAPLMVKEIFKIIRRINEEEKCSILLVEQNVRASLEIADYGYIMEMGKIVLDGPSDKLSDNADVREFYMGLTELGKQKSYRDLKHYKRRKRWLS